MSQFTYNGEEERILPTLSLVVNSGDTFEAPDDFSADGFSTNAAPKKATAPAVAPDTTVGE
jgi:hypothetical protein